MYASFFDTEPGKKLLREATSFSGVSAGAIVATPLALGVQPRAVVKELERGGVGDWLKYPRALATYFKLRKSMYSGDELLNRLNTICHGCKLRKPVSLGVTTATPMKQKTVTYTNEAADLNCMLNTTVASASIPGVFANRTVTVDGKQQECFDGGAADCTFAIEPIREAIQKRERIVLLNSAPWPGYRQPMQNEEFGALIAGHAFDVFNTHGLEWLPRELGDSFKYQDGVFTYDNVTLVAPTGEQYTQSGGNASSANLFYSGHSPFTERLVAAGKQMAEAYNTVSSGFYFNG